MQTKAALMVLVLLSGTIAGCTSDPDGGGNDGIDSDALDDLFDEYFQDFVNNTSITVINHYHNNTTYVVDDGDYSTTVVNEYNNTTTVEGGEVNNYFEEYDYSQDNYSFGGGAGGNGSGETLYLLDIQFTLEDRMPGYEEIDHRNNTIDYTYTYYDGLMNNDTTETFTIQCSDYYLIGSQSPNGTAYTYWQNSNNYPNLWLNLYNQTISLMLQEAAWAQWTLNGLNALHVRIACDENYNMTSGFYDLFLFDIPIPAGSAITGISPDYDGIEQYVWGYENYVSTENYASGTGWWWDHIGYGEMMWRTSYYPRAVSYSYSAFDVDFEFETMDWSYSHGGWIGGDEDSVLTVTVNNIWPGYEYRLIAYFTYVPVIPLE